MEKNTKTKYLYGAAVQGIQSFIFQTNKLKEIVGASIMVDKICTKLFEEVSSEAYENNDNAILQAAGNIKHIFTDRQKCENTVRQFPKKVMEFAPGITLSQAVVEFDESDDFQIVVSELERKLKEQRNKPISSLLIGLSGVKRSQRGGFPAVEIDGDELIDECIKKKNIAFEKEESNKEESLVGKFFGADIEKRKLSNDIQDLTNKNSWIAIIHADGNSLGKIVQKVGNNKDKFKEFSQNLDKATIVSAREAYQEIAANDKYGISKSKYIPFRPIVLGGDDLTLICRADLALPLTEAFLARFEVNTEKYLGGLIKEFQVFEDAQHNKLTACAGIAFIKESYPFYYGYNLAELLCRAAKNDSNNIDKDLAPSCLMFHKVQDSFVEDYKDIVNRELTLTGDYSFKNGPYYLSQSDKKWTITELLEKVDELGTGDEANAVKSHLRQWISLMYENMDLAKQKRERVISMRDNNKLKEIFKTLTTENDKKYPAYDVLTIYSIKNQDTK